VRDLSTGEIAGRKIPHVGKIQVSNIKIGFNMKLTYLFKDIEKATIKLSENQLFSVRGKNIQINCLHGALWVTWPKRGEKILKSGQTFCVSSKGKVCIVALSNASFQMSKNRWYANAKTHQKSDVRNGDTDILPSPFETHGFFDRTEKT